ncbi:MAG TPA: hypothetical protein VKA36_10755 [Solirubrobacterales bacterium]|nr:hypothetical protein [Solirubrobacterales bacterium]
MSEEVHEAWFDDNCLAFDGRVVEMFGFPEVKRWHVRAFGHELNGPDRKGNYMLRVGRMRKGKIKGGGLAGVKAEAWPAVEDVLRRIEAKQAEVGLHESATK